MTGYFELNKSSDGQFRFFLKTADAKTILTSELYKAKSSAENGIASVQSNCVIDDRYERKEAKNGKHYFNLKAANYQIIGTSPMYETAQACEKGIESAKAEGASKTVKDNI